MKEKIIRSFSIPGILVQILDGKFALLHDDKLEIDEDRGGFITDNENYAYEILRLLTKADELGAFDEVKKDYAGEPPEDTIYI